MAVLPIVQSLGVGKNTSMFGSHINRSAAKIRKPCSGEFQENVIFLAVGDRNGKIFTFAIISQQCGRLDTIEGGKLSG